MIEIKITAANYSELRLKLKDMLGMTVSSLEALEEPSLVTVAKEEVKKAAKKIKKKVAKIEEPVVEAEVVEEKEVEVEESSAPIETQASTFKALQKVSSANGLPAARKILKQFNCNRISELNESDFGSFVDACNQACKP